MAFTLEQIDFLTSPAGQELLARSWPGDALSVQKALRKVHTSTEAQAVGAVLLLRDKAAAKFPERFATRWLMSDKQYQQASSWAMGLYKARAMAAAGRPIWDLCCSMGVDALAMAACGAEVRGFDCCESAVACARWNAQQADLADRCEFSVQDVTELAGQISADVLVHIDPDRRATGRRTILLEDYSPNETFLRQLLEHKAGGCMKLSPATDYHLLADWPGAKLEFVSEHGVCKQLIVWWGLPAEDRPARAATVVFGEREQPDAETIAAEDCAAEVCEVGQFLLEPDPAVIAANAVDSLAIRQGGWRVDIRLPWLSCDQPADTSLCRSFEILGECPGREKDIRKLLSQHDAGEVAIKPRGLKLPVDSLQRKFRGGGQTRLVVFWGKFGHKQKAFIAKPVLQG